MKQFLWFYISVSLGAFILITTSVHANNQKPVMMNGTYNMYLDRAKQTFNGHPVSTDRPLKQLENFTTTCNKSGCMAHSSNKRPPPAMFDYRWVDGHWESVHGQQHQFLICKDGSKVNSIKLDIITPNTDGSFSGERTITVTGSGCKGEGPGKYWLPFKLTPIKTSKSK